MDEFAQKYLALVPRIRGYGVPTAAEAWILAEIEKDIPAGAGDERGAPTGRSGGACGAGWQVIAKSGPRIEPA